MLIDETLTDEEYCYMTTVGRVSGKPHEIEIWFAANGDTLYLLAGGREAADWVRNVRRTPAAGLRLGGARFEALGRVVGRGKEDAIARRLLLEKYRPRYSGDLTDWGRDALPVALDVMQRVEVT